MPTWLLGSELGLQIFQAIWGSIHAKQPATSIQQHADNVGLAATAAQSVLTTIAQQIAAAPPEPAK